jgi:hypothetical protein
MDARVKPAHDEVLFVTTPALQRTAASGERPLESNQYFATTGPPKR